MLGLPHQLLSSSEKSEGIRWPAAWLITISSTGYRSLWYSLTVPRVEQPHRREKFVGTVRTDRRTDGQTPNGLPKFFSMFVEDDLDLFHFFSCVLWCVSSVLPTPYCSEITWRYGDSTWNDPIEVATENSIYDFFCLIASFYLWYNLPKRIFWKKNPFGCGSPSKITILLKSSF